MTAVFYNFGQTAATPDELQNCKLYVNGQAVPLTLASRPDVNSFSARTCQAFCTSVLTVASRAFLTARSAITADLQPRPVCRGSANAVQRPVRHTGRPLLYPQGVRPQRQPDRRKRPYFGNTTDYVYDALNRQIETIQPAVLNAAGNSVNPTTVTAYDTAGNVISVTDPDGDTTTYQYDNLNHKKAETDALEHTTTYSYDTAGNLVSATDPKGNTADYIYDALDRKIEEIDPDPSTGQASPERSGLPQRPTGLTPPTAI